MILKELKIENFRSHNLLHYNFEKGINVIEGENGVGKTNVVEAIYYLSIARSFRKADDSELIKDSKQFSEINAVIDDCNIKRRIKIIITKEGKRIFINNKKINKISELSNIVNASVFEPKDVFLFKDSPRERRNFLDLVLSKKSNVYFNNLSNYMKVMKERNILLKQTNIDKNLLEVLTNQLVEISEKIVTYRMSCVKDINDILNNIAYALTHTHRKFELSYKPFVEYDSKFKIKTKEIFDKNLENDFKNKATTIGIHREDFKCLIDGKDIGIYGSQGENRIAAIALKLTPYFLEENQDRKPIIILDDVMSELDEIHQINLINFLKKLDQVFITTTKLDDKEIKHYLIK